MAAAPARTVILQRSNDGIVFTPIINTPTEPTINTYLFEDPNLPVGNQTFTYRVNLLDSCFNTHTSDTATTLRVGIKVKSNNRADIIWSGFDISNISFDNFRLEKIIGSDTTFVGNFNRSETTFLETALFDYGADSLSAVCYRVTAFLKIIMMLRQEKHWPAILILCVCSRNLKRLCRKRLYLPDTIKHLSHFYYMPNQTTTTLKSLTAGII